MKKKLATLYAVGCSLLLLAGSITVFVFAWRAGNGQTVAALVGLLLGALLSPVLHELGHIAFGQAAKMEYVYVKFLCFQICVIKGKRRLRFASPFAADQTQMIPKTGGNMQKRAIKYTLGGLVFSGIFALLLVAAATICSCVGKTNYALWGAVPYAAYLFLLNVMPVTYAGGKTDALVYRGIKRGEDAERCMLSAMEIHGRLSEGKSFSEIDEKYYFDLPQLAEEEPLFAISLDLRYRYYLGKEDFDKAADCLNRLALAQEYLPEAELEKVAAELVYMHSINGDLVRAEESSRLCKGYLAGESVTAKRILAAYSCASGKTEAVPILLEQAEEALQYERVLGLRKFEKALLSRIKTNEKEKTERYGND